MLQKFKQIHFDEDTGKLFISDSNGNNYHCNIYGQRKPKFLPNITGFSTFNDRKEKNDYNFNLNFNAEKTLYRPQHKRFEGYSQFPRPLSQPFFNERFNKNENDKLLNLLINDNRINFSKNKHLLELKSNEGLHYFTSSLCFTDESSKKKFISMIDNHLKECREKYKYRMDEYKKDIGIKALKKLKKLMIDNTGDKLIFGRHLPTPDAKSIERFNLNSRMMKKQKINLDEKVESDKSKLIDYSINTTNYGSTFYGKIDELNLSALSRESNEEKLEKVRKRENLEKNFSTEKRLLTGYRADKIKEKGISVKSHPKFLKTPGQLYSENMDILRRTNPLAFLKEERKNKLYDNVLKKKKEIKMVTQKNLGF